MRALCVGLFGTCAVLAVYAFLLTCVKVEYERKSFELTTHTYTEINDLLDDGWSVSMVLSDTCTSTVYLRKLRVGLIR